MTTILIASFLTALFGVFNILGIKQTLFPRQILYVVIAYSIYFILKKINRNFFVVNARVFYWLFVIILAITYVIGFEVKGSKRWIDFYFFNFQGSEFFKIFFILFLSSYLSKETTSLTKTSQFLKSLIYFFTPFFIIFKQPDLGNAMVFIVIYLVILFFSDIPKRYLMTLATIIILILPLGWRYLKHYQKDRIVSFLNPHIDQQGISYNMHQAAITIGSGKFLGRGMGLGTQSRLYFLPESQTDFAYASLVEQFGFIGGLSVILFYFLIIAILINKTLKFYYQKDEEGKQSFLYLIGFLSYFTFQVIVNLGMNLGLLPIAGVALPFISYGGSSVAALMLGMALMP